MESNGSTPKASSSRSGVGMKAAIIVILALAVGAALYLKGQKAASVTAEDAAKPAATIADAPAPTQTADAATKAALPRLVDLGAGKCIPCRMMAPILEEMKKTYAGKLDVVFIDVWEKPDEAKKFNINLIPTQILYDASGKERFRHEGFFSKEDILAKWKELGVDLSASK